MINVNEIADFLFDSFVKQDKLFESMIDSTLDLISPCYENDLVIDGNYLYNQAIRLNFLQRELKSISKIIFLLKGKEDNTQTIIINSFDEIIGQNFKYGLNEAIEHCENLIKEYTKERDVDFASFYEKQKYSLKFIYSECQKIGIFK